MTRMPEVDMAKCNLCGISVEICKCSAIVIEAGVVRFIETEACGWCTICEAVCPTGALVCAFNMVDRGPIVPFFTLPSCLFISQNATIVTYDSAQFS